MINFINPFKILVDIKNDLIEEGIKLIPKQSEKIIVAKPYCSPARNTITGIFNEYGVSLLYYKEYTYFVNHEGNRLPYLKIAECTVSSKQAVWAEYLLLRSKKFILRSRPKHKRNQEWAERHNAMPESWNGKPLIEKSCKDGKKAIQLLKDRKKRK